MIIKKITKTAVRSTQAEADVAEPEVAAPAVGAAAIADRFKLDAPAADAPVEVKRSTGGIGATLAVVAGLVALAVAGILTFIIYQHWGFLQAA